MNDKNEQSVLLIDDSADIHQLVGVRLRSEDVTLVHAYNATQGLERAMDTQPDLILLDVNMPGTDGMTLCRQLKADQALEHIPVIFLTGALDTATKVKAFDLGAVDYVTKPFDAVELKARVRAALRTKRYHDLLVTKAQIDALTGLWNRGRFNNQLTDELAVLERHGHPVSLMMIDIDHFKPVNDTYGHPFGDTVLRRVAAVLNGASRDTDVVCRYGGEEFIVVLRNTARAGARVIAERIRDEIAALKFLAGRKAVQVTVSVGVAGSDAFESASHATGEALLKAADKALYTAKSGGRNRVE